MHFGNCQSSSRAGATPSRLRPGSLRRTSRALRDTGPRLRERAHRPAVAPEPLDRRLAAVDQEVAVVVERHQRVDDEVGGGVQQRDRARQDHQHASLVRIPAALEDVRGAAAGARHVAAGEARHQQQRKPEPARTRHAAGRVGSARCSSDPPPRGRCAAIVGGLLLAACASGRPAAPEPTESGSGGAASGARVREPRPSRRSRCGGAPRLARASGGRAPRRAGAERARARRRGRVDRDREGHAGEAPDLQLRHRSRSGRRRAAFDDGHARRARERARGRARARARGGARARGAPAAGRRRRLGPAAARPAC